MKVPSIIFTTKNTPNYLRARLLLPWRVSILLFPAGRCTVSALVLTHSKALSSEKRTFFLLFWSRTLVLVYKTLVYCVSYSCWEKKFWCCLTRWQIYATVEAVLCGSFCHFYNMIRALFIDSTEWGIGSYSQHAEWVHQSLQISSVSWLGLV